MKHIKRPVRAFCDAYELYHIVDKDDFPVCTLDPDASGTTVWRAGEMTAEIVAALNEHDDLIKQRDTLIEAIKKAQALIELPANYSDILKAHGVLSDALALIKGEE